MQDLRVTLVQTSIHWEDVGANLSLLDAHFEKIAGNSTDLIVLPEMFSTGFTMNNKALAEEMNGRTMQWMASIAKEKNCVVTGSIIIASSPVPLSKRSGVEGGEVYFNRLIWMRPDGTFETYDKRHLFRYANEQNFYSAGTKKLIVELKGWKVCPLICYDLRFPVWARRKSPLATNPGKGDGQYDLLIYIANWPERRIHPWRTLLMARAIENQSFVVGLNRIGEDGNKIYHSGDSAVINPKGEIISKTQPHKESVETVILSKAELDEWRKNFPAWMDADEFDIL